MSAIARKTPITREERRDCKKCGRRVQRGRGLDRYVWVHVRPRLDCETADPYKTKRTPKRTSLRNQCDELASLICKYLGNFRCFRCNKWGTENAKGERIVGLEWSHRPSAKRSHSMAVRWDEDAADCACHDCHRYLETRPVEYNALLVDLGVNIYDLERRAHLLWDKTYPVAHLKERLKELKEAA